MSSSRTAECLPVIGPSVIALFIVHILIEFQISNKRCYASLNEIYVLFFNVYSMMIIIVPVIVMTLFSILIFVNARRSHRRAIPSFSVRSNVQLTFITHNEAIQQRDTQFIRLALIQVFTFVIFAIGYGIYNAYDFLTSSMKKSSERQATEAFISRIAVNFNYVTAATPFFSYTLTMNKFRKDCIETFRRYYRIIVRCFGQ
ncbi:unnamed protein product [Rotaria magnacalcarata]|uniref:G-protein coupled receptors family 1 profile domain-containing protein n=1 Tax=Rotaria magnacalcarata TaxID=392030 RepID=A0A819XS19_9BILA|nr:unnamed protein product [Rotaria magnacalcarata]